jgi:hypothetical protein
MDGPPRLASITGTGAEDLLRRHEYLLTETRLLRQQLTGRLPLTHAERRRLAEIGQTLGQQALEEVASRVKPETILAWPRPLGAQKFDGSTPRKALGRPRSAQAREDVVGRLAQEHRRWGDARLAGAWAHRGDQISDQPVGNRLKRHGRPSAPERTTTTTWHESIRAPMDVLVATDCCTTDVGTLGGFVPDDGVCFIHWGEPSGACGRGHPAAPCAVDDARGTPCDAGGVGGPGSRARPHPRPGWPVLPRVAMEPR